MMKETLRALTLAALVLTLVFPLSALAGVPQGTEAPQQQGAQKPPEATISIEVPVVTLDVVATTQHGDMLTGLKKENFRILEDGVQQTVGNFAPSDTPITIVIVMEFSNLFSGYFSYVAQYWADDFFNNLKKDDWVALVSFDMKPTLQADFTQDKNEVRDALRHLYYPGFSESNLFDAVLDTVDRLKDVKGKKSILIIASGFDTFSKHTLDQTLKQLRQTDVTIFSVGVARPIQNWIPAHGGMGRFTTLGFAQAENQLRTFAQMTGGFSWFPSFDGEIPGIFKDVAAYLRNQYSLAYSPTNRARDGKFRKIKVELVNADGTPLIVTDQKGKKLKTVAYVRQGYTAPKEAAAN
jgi:Ca-activated chloride channel homolog